MSQRYDNSDSDKGSDVGGDGSGKSFPKELTLREGKESDAGRRHWEKETMHVQS